MPSHRVTAGVRRRCASLTAVVVVLGLAACSDDSGEDASPKSAKPSATADIVQLRRDVVLQRVEVALENTGSSDFRVTRLRLVIPGFALPGGIVKDSPIPAGQVVNLPVPFDKVKCPADGAPDVGTPRVTLLVDSGGDPPIRRVELDSGDGDGLLQRIADRLCAVEQLQREVDLRFDNHWRLERTPSGKELHGVIHARLLRGGARTIKGVLGAVMYGLVPEQRNQTTPLATITPAHREAKIPVVAFAARCDGHTIGEIKRPYEFLVYVGEKGGEDIAVTPTVEEGTKLALRRVCAF